MALNLAKELTIYTNGNDEIAADIEKNAQIAAFKTRVTIEKRAIKSLRMVALWEASDVLVTLEDGTEIKEKFLVSCITWFIFVCVFFLSSRLLIHECTISAFIGWPSKYRIKWAVC